KTTQKKKKKQQNPTTQKTKKQIKNPKQQQKNNQPNKKKQKRKCTLEQDSLFACSDWGKDPKESSQKGTSEVLQCAHCSELSFGFGTNPNLSIGAIASLVVWQTDREKFFTKAYEGIKCTLSKSADDTKLGGIPVYCASFKHCQGTKRKKVGCPRKRKDSPKQTQN
ncbi:unnamed protein product, partial [Bubo scandiacus]